MQGDERPLSDRLRCVRESLGVLMGPPRRVRRASLLVASVAALASGQGCGGAAGASSEVRATLRRFASAVADRDYVALCDELLAPELTTRLARIGLPCERAMARGLGGVQRPSLTVLSVRVSGQSASAVVRTSASNQAPSEDTVELSRSSEGWRITSLGSASP